jgi:hypothetical protein
MATSTAPTTHPFPSSHIWIWRGARREGLRQVKLWRRAPGGEALAAGASRLEGAPAWICIAGPPSSQSVTAVTGPRPHLLPIARAILPRVTTGGPRSAPPFAAALPPPRTQAAVAAPTWFLAIFV